MLGLGTFTFLILIYFFRIFLGFIFLIILKINNESNFTKQIYRIIISGLFFNSILSMSIEGFIDFNIFGYLNIKTAEFTMSGEQLGLGLGVFTLSLSGFILPFTILC